MRLICFLLLFVVFAIAQKCTLNVHEVSKVKQNSRVFLEDMSSKYSPHGSKCVVSDDKDNKQEFEYVNGKWHPSTGWKVKKSKIISVNCVAEHNNAILPLDKDEPTTQVRISTRTRDKVVPGTWECEDLKEVQPAKNKPPARKNAPKHKNKNKNKARMNTARMPNAPGNSPDCNCRTGLQIAGLVIASLALAFAIGFTTWVGCTNPSIPKPKVG